VIKKLKYLKRAFTSLAAVVCFFLASLVSLQAQAAALNRPLANSYYLCNMVLKGLHASGYTEGAAYSVEAIKSLLQKNGVVPPTLAGLDATKRYELLYSCQVEGGLAQVHLLAHPVSIDPTESNTFAVIRWEVTN